MSFQLFVRLAAWCIGAIAVADLAADVMEIGNRKEGEGLEATVRFLWITTLVGIPCLIIGLKGIRFGPEARKTRKGGLLCVAGGLGALLLSGLLTFLAHFLDNAFNLGAGVLATGPYVIGLILIYAGTVTAISGVDIRAEMSR